MLDPLGAATFSLTTAFALTVDVGLFATAAFATAPRPREAGRFAFEVAVAHASLLLAGAAAAHGLLRALGDDLVVDVVASLALLIVLRGAVARARNEPQDEKPTTDSRAVSWFTAFALSIDAFLVGPTAREFASDATVGEIAVLLLSIFVGVLGFAWGYAAFARRMNSRVLARLDGTSAFVVASLAEIVVFCVFFADAVFRALEHAGSTVGGGAARGIGVLLGLAVFAIARRTSSEPGGSTP